MNKIKKIIITGPESTGKTTLTSELAQYFKTMWVPEFARTYIDDLKRPYREDDLLRIAKGQRDLERFFYKKSNQYLFCDTSMLVLKIWSEYRFGKCHSWILEELEKENALYVLCGTDVEWEADPQRENPNDRNELYEIYRKELIKYKKEYIEVSDNQEVRRNKVIRLLLQNTFTKL